MRTALIFGLAGSAALTLALAIFGLAKLRRKKGAWAYIGLMLAAADYCAAYALELGAQDLPAMLAAIRIEYLGIAPMPALILLMALQYTDVFKKTGPLQLLGLFAVPAVTLALVYTNTWHGLYYRSTAIDLNGPFPTLRIVPGAWYYVQAAYFSLAFSGSCVLYGRRMLQAGSVFRKQTIILFFIFLMALAVHVGYVLRLVPFSIDPNPLVLAFMSPFITLTLFRYRFMDIAPVAREKIVAEMDAPVIILDAADRLIDYNRAAVGVVPSLSRTAIGSELRTLAGAGQKISEALRGPEGEKPLRLQDDGGAQRCFMVRSTPFGNSGGSRKGTILMLTDITAHWESERRLTLQRDELGRKNVLMAAEVSRTQTLIREREELLTIQARSAAVGELLDFVAHQWNQNLCALSLMLDAFRNQAEAGRVLKSEDVQLLSRHLASMADTIRDFRDFIAPRQKEAGLFPVREALLAGLELMRDPLLLAGIAVLTDLETGITVRGFSNELSQVLINLLDNARKIFVQRATENPAIDLRLRRDGQEVTISIADNAGGIDPAVRPRLFERVESTTGGSGLGLFIARLIVEQHFGGTVAVKHREDGSEFILRLPGPDDDS